MTDELLYCKIEAKGFQDLCNRIAELEAENEQLVLEKKESHELLKSVCDENRQLKRQISNMTRAKLGLKLNNRELAEERNELVKELNDIKGMSMFEFGNTYCSSESLEADGHAFARALLGGK